MASRLYNIVILGSNYKGRNGQTLFAQNLASAQEALFATAPFNTLQPNIRIYAAISKQNLGCDSSHSGFNEGFVCNPAKVMNAAASLVGSNFVDKIIVLANGEGHGGADGDLIAAVGLGNQASSQFCTFVQAAFYGKMMHELGHNFLGPSHVEGTKMGSCTNGCCAIWNIPFSTTQQETITNSILADIA